jgi:hypothetical protein
MLSLNATFVDAVLRKSPRLEFLANRDSLCAKTAIMSRKWRKKTSKIIKSSMKAEKKAYLSLIKSK